MRRFDVTLLVVVDAPDAQTASDFAMGLVDAGVEDYLNAPPDFDHGVPDGCDAVDAQAVAVVVNTRHGGQNHVRTD